MGRPRQRRTGGNVVLRHSRRPGRSVSRTLAKVYEWPISYWKGITGCPLKFLRNQNCPFSLHEAFKFLPLLLEILVLEFSLLFRWSISSGRRKHIGGGAVIFLVITLLCKITQHFIHFPERGLLIITSWNMSIKSVNHDQPFQADIEWLLIYTLIFH